MLLSIWELVSIMSLVYLSISEFSFLLECRLAACQQELKFTFRTKEKCVFFFPLSFPLFSYCANRMFILLGPLWANFSLSFFSWKSLLWLHWCPCTYAGFWMGRHANAPDINTQRYTHKMQLFMYSTHRDLSSCSSTNTLCPDAYEEWDIPNWHNLLFGRIK